MNLLLKSNITNYFIKCNLTKTKTNKQFFNTNYHKVFNKYQLKHFTSTNSNKSNSNLPTPASYFHQFIKKLKAMMNKRVVAFRILFYSSFLLIVFSFMRYSNSTNFAKNVTPVFFLNNECSEHFFYNVAGIVKPGTIQMIKGTDEMSFVITDYEHQMNVFYKGIVPANFLEGNTVIATGSLTNVKKPDTLMCTKVLTDHGYNSDQWLSKLYNNI